MIEAIPSRALFRFEIAIQRIRKPPLLSGDVSRWDERFAAPALCQLDGQTPFADVFWAWDDDAFYASYRVRGKKSPPECDTAAWWKKDGFRLCIDTRDARDIRRATRFCRLFYVLPVGGGPRGKAPLVGTHRMSRAREPAPEVDLSAVRTAVRVERDGYGLEIAIPTSCLTGWDPVEHPRIGIFYKVKDVHLGGQQLSATDDMGWNVDPSTWATGVLTPASA